MSIDGFETLFGKPAEKRQFQPLFAAGEGSTFAPATWSGAGQARRERPGTAVEQLLTEAREQAAKVLRQAQEEAEALLPRYLQEALGEARAEQVGAFEAAAKELLQALRLEHEQALERLERETALLVGELVGRIVRSAAPEAIVPVVREAIQHLSGSGPVQVVVAPEHDEALRAAYQELAAVLPEEARLEIVVSDAAELFGCVAHGVQGSVDARLSTRLETIERVVREQVLGSEAA